MAEQRIARRRTGPISPFDRPSMADVWFDRFFLEFPRMMGTEEQEWSPHIDFYEKEGKYYLIAELPGMKKEDIGVYIDGDMVTISGKKQSRRKEKGADFYLCESQSGYFSRNIRMPSEVDEEKIEANYKDGILNVAMSPSEVKKRKTIEIH